MNNYKGNILNFVFFVIYPCTTLLFLSVMLLISKIFTDFP
jgi:hypothetical protein